jgi:predicted nucleic acid-binding protein
VSVIDASVWVSRLVPLDVFHTPSRLWLSKHAAAGGLLVSPVLLPIEVAGAISRRTGERQLAHQALETLMRAPALRIVPLDSRLGRAAAALAADLGLRGADGVYVALARALNLPLLTWDEDQRHRAGHIIAAYTPEMRDPHIL